MVERLVANEKVEGSTPFARSKKIMTDLLEKKCVPCEGGVKAFDISEISNGVTPPSHGIHFLLNKSVIVNLERAKGVEPSTFSLATRRSTTELCPQLNYLEN